MTKFLIVSWVCITILSKILLDQKQYHAQRQPSKKVSDSRIKSQPKLFSTTYYGNEPRADYAPVKPIEGALKLGEQALIFSTPGLVRVLDIPLPSIRWIGIHQIWGLTSYEEGVTGLAIHYVNEFQIWRAAMFEASGAYSLLVQLNQATGLDGVEIHWSEPRPDFGPSTITRMEQDIYGQWHETSEGDLYLTPTGHLLFGYRFDQSMTLDQLRSIDVIERGGPLNDLVPALTELLRLEYENGDGQHQVIGYKMRNADAMAQVLSARSGVPYQAMAGRKKKMKD